MIPPIVVPWPLMNLVAECTTISAPRSIGRHRYGEANVLSTTSGMPCLCASFASPARSASVPDGLPIVSAKSSLVFGRIAASIAAKSSTGAKLVSMPMRRIVMLNCVTVPP